jgi:hypothetical protein
MIEHIKIDMGRVSLDPTQNVQGLILIKYFELVIQPQPSEIQS